MLNGLCSLFLFEIQFEKHQCTGRMRPTQEEQDVIYLLSAIQYLLDIRISNYIPHIQMLSSDGCAGPCSSGGKKLDLISTALNMKCWGTQHSWSTEKVLVVWIMQMKVPLR